MKLHIVRHTTPAVEPGTCYGQTDLDLADSFDREATGVKARLHDHYPIVITSPLQRCHRLAQTLSCDDLQVDRRILELDFGDWEMRPWQSLQGATAAAWMNDFVNLAPPNGESLKQMQSRVIEFMEELEALDYASAAVVTHAGVLRLINAWVLDIPIANSFRLGLDYGAIQELEINRKSGLRTIKFL